MILTVTMNVAIDKRYVVDAFEIGTVMRVKECSYTAGGKGLNVSKVAAIAGEEVTATGLIGGYAGEFVLSELDKVGVKHDFVKVDGETRSCINFFDNASGKQTEFLEPGVTASKADGESFLRKYAQLVKSAQVVSISGSVPKGIDPDYYNELIKIAKSEHKTVLLDASGNLLKTAIKAKPDFIKPNTDEIEMLLGGKTESIDEIIASAKKLHNSGIKYVVVSLGKDGAVLVCKDGAFRGYTPDVPVVNTVGCGDSMVAAFAVGLSRKEPLEQILKEALAISTANALRVETGYYLKEDMEKLLNMVRTEQI